MSFVRPVEALCFRHINDVAQLLSSDLEPRKHLVRSEVIWLANQIIPELCVICRRQTRKQALMR